LVRYYSAIVSALKIGFTSTFTLATFIRDLIIRIIDGSLAPYPE